MLRVNANSAIKYKSIINIDTKRPYKCPGGNSFTTTRIIRDSDENQTGKVTQLTLKNTDGYFGFTNDNETKSKAYISLGVEKNPAIGALGDSLTEGYAVACDNAGIPRPKDFVSRNQVNKKKPEEVYPDSVFVQVNLGPEYACCGSKLVYVEDNEERIIYGSTDFDEGEELNTIKSYIRYHIADDEIVKFICEAYGVSIENMSKEKKTFKLVGIPKTKRRLLEPAEFQEVMKVYNPVFIFAKMKPTYVRNNTETFATIMVTKAICEERVSNSKEMDDEYESCLKEYSRMKSAKPKSQTVEEINPEDDVDNLLN